MANLSHIARPYAQAAFACARDKQQLPAWKTWLAAIAMIAKQPLVIHTLSRPDIQSAQALSLFTDVLAIALDAEQKNFLHLLAQNKRLLVLPQISEAFDAYYAAHEKISAVRVVSAIELNDGYRQTLAAALTKRIKREVTLHCEVNPTILGGAIIHIGDSVIDGSVRGKLNRLLQDLAG